MTEMISERADAPAPTDRYDARSDGLCLRLSGTSRDHAAALHFDVDVSVENGGPILNLKDLIEAKLAKHLDEATDLLPLLLGRDIQDFHARFKLGEIDPASLRVWRFECERHESTAAWYSSQKFSLIQPLNFERVKEGNYREVETKSATGDGSRLCLTGRVNLSTGAAKFAVADPATGQLLPPVLGDQPAKVGLRGVVELLPREPQPAKDSD